jgi:hypothetical protein
MKNRLVVTVSEAYIARMNEIAEILRQRGNEIVETYPFGVLIVCGEAGEINDLKKIPGIEEVTIEQSFGLPPHKPYL